MEQGNYNRHTKGTNLYKWAQAVVTMQGGTTKPPYMDFPYQNHSGLSLLSSSISSSSGKARVRSSVKKKISS